MYKFAGLLVFIVLLQLIGNALAGQNPGRGDNDRGDDNGRGDDFGRGRGGRGDEDDFGRGRRDRWTWCRCRAPRGRDEL